MENGTELSRTDFLRFNRRSPDTDRASVEDEIGSTGRTWFRFGQSGFNEYVAATSDDSQSTTHISKGRSTSRSVTTPTARGSSDGDNWILQLSTH